MEATSLPYGSQCANGPVMCPQKTWCGGKTLELSVSFLLKLFLDGRILKFGSTPPLRGFLEQETSGLGGASSA